MGISLARRCCGRLQAATSSAISGGPARQESSPFMVGAEPMRTSPA
jgi:hypothetical protein